MSCMKFHSHDHAEHIPPASQGKILFKNCTIFDGINEQLATGQDVLVEKNLISKIVPTGSTSFDNIDTILDCEGRTLIPGLIDCHWHSVVAALDMASLMNSDMTYIGIVAGCAAKETLLRGFTSCRDLGGATFGLKKATDNGTIEGPRLYPCGAFISQTSGHFDFRPPNYVPSNPGDSLDYLQRNGMMLVCDGVPEILKRTREVLRMGATQIKIAGGGGVASQYDYVDVSEFRLDEVKAAVDCAKAWNTYVCAHVFTDAAIRTCVEAGVKTIEHGNLASRETLELMKEKDVWLSFQPILNDEDAIPFPPGSPQQEKFEYVTNGTIATAKMAKEIGVKMAFGTDILFDKKLADKQGRFLSKMPKCGFTPYEALKMATSTNAEVLKLCNQRDPYPHALGVVQEGAYADLILVDGNPLEDLDLISQPKEKFIAIMKDGKLHKNMFE